MAAVTVRAFSYLRFSSAEQAKGDSLRRQSTLAADYALSHGLELDESLTFQDLGVSAFRGTNARTGALGAFLRAVDMGVVPAGSYLLVESLDRVSRQDPWDAMPVFQQIINAGITLVSLQDRKVYSREELRANPLKIMESLFVMIRANEESATKGRRLRAAWSQKRATAATKPLTAKCPSWLRLDPQTRRFEVIEERAAVVRRIFDEAARGESLNGITTRLNQDGIAPFGIPNRETRDFWGRSTVAKIIDSPAAGGIFVPHRIEHVEGNKRRIPQDAITGYFPAVVPSDVFEIVRAQRGGRPAPKTRAATGVRNLVAGLATCPACGSTMTRVNKGTATPGKAGRDRLTCVSAKARRCAAPSAVLVDVEDALRRHAQAIFDEAPRGEDEVLTALDRAAMAVEASEARLSGALDALIASPGSSALRFRVDDLEAQRDQARKTLQGLQGIARASGVPMVENRLKRLRDALADATAEPDAVNGLLREALTEVQVDGATGVATLHWRQGGKTEVVFGWGKPGASPRGKV
ncbi:recombinase family protein [Pararoseomonas indoligenes]|uniref:Recombinase family protein n=1 Tax=Roseomonas indoligenes TaxID=2820811 RepID=A0A940MRP3_9PROT|nr:recombinase family protein [Pararoseomonas indoligenes]